MFPGVKKPFLSRIHQDSNVENENLNTFNNKSKSLSPFMLSVTAKNTNNYITLFAENTII